MKKNLKSSGKKTFSFLFIILLLASFFVALAKISSVQAETIFEEGFETGDFSALTGNTTSETYGFSSVTNSPVHHGSYAGNFTTTSIGAWTNAYVTKTVDAFTEGYVRAYVYIDSHSSGAVAGLLGFENPRIGIDASNNLKLQYYNASTASYDTSATTLNLDTWYCLELYFLGSATVGVVKTYLDGVEIADITQTNLNTSLTRNKLEIGVISGYSTAVSVIVDCAVYSSTYIGVEEEEPEVYTAQDIQDLIDAAEINDTITLNGETYYWHGDRVNITKPLHLDANYSTFQQVHDGEFGTMVYVTATGGIINITKANFIGNVTQNSEYVVGIGISFFDVKDFRVSYCNFTDFPNMNIAVVGQTASRGVIDHCRMNQPYREKYGGLDSGYGIVVSSNSYADWDSDITHFLGKYETANASYPMVYIENNYINGTRHAVSSNQRGWYVIRFNTFEQQNYNSVVDVHGSSEIGAGGRGLEAYNNTIIGVSYGFALRGGSGIVYNNTIYNAAIGIQVAKDISGTPLRPMDDLWFGENNFIDVATNFTNADSYYTEDVNYFLRMPTQELDGFTYTAFPYPHYFVSGEEAPTYTYVTAADFVSPANTTYPSSTVGFEVSTAGSNDTNVDDHLQIQLYDEGGAVYPENFTSATGTFTDLVNGTYTAAVYAVGDNGASDYETVIFTVAIPEPTYYITVTPTAPENTTYTESSIPHGASLAGNGTSQEWSSNVWNGTAYIFTANMTSANATFTLAVNGTYRIDFWASDAEGSTGTANVTFTVAIGEEPEPTPTPTATTSLSNAELTVYILLVVIAIMFTLIALSRLVAGLNVQLNIDWLSPVVNAIAFICWLILVPLHLAFVGTTSAFLSAPAILYFAFAIIFLLFAIKGVFDNLAASTSIRERVDVLD